MPNVLASLGAGGGFLPSDIATIQYWFRADSLSLSDGAAISSWPDSSKNGYTASQATGANQPLFKTAIVNGRPVVRFDGVNDSLTTGTVTHGIGTGDWAFAAVAKATNASSPYLTIACNGSYTPAWYINATRPTLDTHTVDDKFSPGLGSATWYLLHFQRSGTTLSCYVNGTVDTLTFTFTETIPNGVCVIGDDSTAVYFLGDIAELMLFSSALTTVQRTNLQGYIHAKYAIF